nr:phytanoyl-CoA dioxygenase family protein [Massilia sp. TS11]
MTPNAPAFTNPLPGVPAIESPFFAPLFADADPATRALAQQLHEHGYAVIDFPEPDFERLAAEIQAALTPHFAGPDWERFRSGGGADLRIRDAWTGIPAVQRIAANGAVLDLLSRLYGARAWPFQTLNFPVGTQQGAHTDAVHFNSAPERFMCGVWVALEDVSLDQGPLFYYPGSHQWPIYGNEHVGRCVSTLPARPDQTIYEPMWQALIAAKGAQRQLFTAKKGQALIWAANLMHGGSPQLNRQLTRWSQVTHYFFEGTAWYAPMFSDPFYGQIYFRRLRNIATGEPMRQTYAGWEIPEAVFEALRSTQPNGPYQFDADAYLCANPDVAAAGVDPLAHYLRHGHAERRRLRP